MYFSEQRWDRNLSSLKRGFFCFVGVIHAPAEWIGIMEETRRSAKWQSCEKIDFQWMDLDCGVLYAVLRNRATDDYCFVSGFMLEKLQNLAISMRNHLGFWWLVYRDHRSFWFWNWTFLLDATRGGALSIFWSIFTPRLCESDLQVNPSSYHVRNV